jgi:MATE family multidrug resistance protein
MAARRLSTTAERQPLLGRTNSQSSGTSKDTDRPNDSDFSLRDELGVLLRYSGPLVITYLLQYGYQMVVILVASQLSTDELAGVSLGITTSNIIGYAIFEGMATSLDTLCSQAYGSGRLSDVGMSTVRFLVFVHLAAVPIAVLWMFSEAILRALVPSAELAAHAGKAAEWIERSNHMYDWWLTHLRQAHIFAFLLLESQDMPASKQARDLCKT